QATPIRDARPSDPAARARAARAADDPWHASPPTEGLAPLLPEIRLLVGLTTAAVIITALYFGRGILVPLALAVLLGFVLDPMVSWLKRLGLPRVSAVVLVVTLALGSIGLAGLALGNQVSSLSRELPTYQFNILSKLRDLRSKALGPGMFDGAVETLKVVKQEVDKAATEEAPAVRPTRKAEPPPVQRVRIEPTPPTPFEEALAWIEAGSGPLATAGIVLVFVFLVLLDRDDLRDRLLRLLGGSLHRSTDAMDEAGRRISKYLTMQLIVNLTYGVPMAAGLWLIGVPGAMLWGAVAAIMRFVPYIGPMVAAVAPLTLAFAVDPGWSMVLWTIGLIGLLELVSNNIVEPWLYGSSTGLSAISLIAAATFWTALWGPVGLIMSTPLTVCLLVIGRHLPRLSFLDVLLGSQPALDAATRIYQRLLAGEVDAAFEVATEQLVEADVAAFYNTTGLAVLRMATLDHASVASAEHRHRLVVGTDALIDDLIEQHPPNAASAPVTAVCIGGKWEIDTLAARMLAHSLSLAGLPAAHRPSSLITADYIDRLDLGGVKTVCLSFFSPEPHNRAQTFCRRLRRRWPHLHIVLALWNAPAELLEEAALRDLGADAVVTSLTEALMQMAHALGTELSTGYLPAPIPEFDADRLAALRASGALDRLAQPLLDAAARRVADIFDVPMAMVSLIDADHQRIPAIFGQPSPSRDGEAGAALRAQDLEMPRTLSLCGHVVANARTMVVPDLARDLRFAGNPALKDKGLRFYAGAPLRDQGGHVLGTLCILDVQPRSLTQRELELLESMADDLMAQLRAQVLAWGDAMPARDAAEESPSAIVGQPVPSSG
ncbi:MAG: AI-2E family transporter, partial [Burkholderiaceae bacterium]